MVVYRNACIIYFHYCLYFIRRPVSEVYDEPQVTRYGLDEKFIKELEAEEISRPELKLKSYNWNTDQDEVKFRKIVQDHTQYVTVCILLNILT